jgi:hypothetical protein
VHTVIFSCPEAESFIMTRPPLMKIPFPITLCFGRMLSGLIPAELVRGFGSSCRGRLAGGNLSNASSPKADSSRASIQRPPPPDPPAHHLSPGPGGIRRFLPHPDASEVGDKPSSISEAAHSPCSVSVAVDTLGLETSLLAELDEADFWGGVWWSVSIIVCSISDDGRLISEKELEVCGPSLAMEGLFCRASGLWP